MFPKPHKHYPLNEIKRLSGRRKAVTIVAGFRCAEGVVLCADTQETISNISKRNVPKLRIEPSDLELATWSLRSSRDIGVAFCGATDDGAFMDEIVDRAWKEVKNANSLDEASELINQSLKGSYKEFGEIYQPGYLPSTELVYGIKMEGKSRLFYAFGPAVNEKTEYATGGVGCYMADFLASRMYKTTLNLRQCVILAAYVLFQTKEHVAGCGGDSHIAVLRNTGTSDRIGWHRVQALTKLLKHADPEIGRILLHYADLRLKDEEIRKSVTETLDILLVARESERIDLKGWEDFWASFSDQKLDDLGLPAAEEE